MPNNNFIPQPPSTVDTAAYNVPDLYSQDIAEGQKEQPEKVAVSPLSDGQWLRRARDAYQQSTSYVDANMRKEWEDSINMFNNTHVSDSKYNAVEFQKRSRLFRPKTREMIRKNEAASASAFFSNADIVNVQAQNPSNQQEVMSAAIMKELLAYRLTKSINWFKVIQGGIQDAQVQGVVCAHVHWKTISRPVKQDKVPSKKKGTNLNDVDEMPYVGPVDPLKHNPAFGFQGEEMKSPEINSTYVPMSDGYRGVSGKPKVEVHVNEIIEDRPCIDLIPVENIRIDPASDWADPINSSPYVIHVMSMFVGDIKTKMNSGEWDEYPDGIIRQAIGATNTTKVTRNSYNDDPYDNDGKQVGDYESAWVQRHIHRVDGEDWEFYTLGDLVLLTDPQPLSATVFHGERPYVLGTTNLETHKVYSTSIALLGKGLQDEANDIANQRLDNVKFSMNKRWVVNRTAQVDLGSLVRNVPGSITMATDVDKDIREITTPDVTQSSYAEQDRINSDYDALLGNFSASSIATNRQLAETAKGMSLLSQSTNVMVEYLLRTYVETFVEPVLRQLVKLEQHYETDETVLAIAGAKAQANQKFGVNKVTDEMLQGEMTLSVNVGMGATNPDQRIGKLVTGLNTYMNIAMASQKLPVINVQEVGKEIFGALGYDDGSRFINQQIDPHVAQMQQQLQQMAMALKSRADLKQQDNMTKVKIADQNNRVKIALEDIKSKNAANHMLAQQYIDFMKQQTYPDAPPQQAQGQAPQGAGPAQPPRQG
jgi:hypothetical protein